jgi:hypothetical protein
MPRVKKSDGIFCPLCGCEMTTLVSAYNSKPFIDGRYYDQICFECNEVPQTFHFDEATNEVVCYPWRPDRLLTYEQMCEDVGYDRKDKELKKRLTKSIRAVKSAINSMNTEKRTELIKASIAGEKRGEANLAPEPVASYALTHAQEAKQARKVKRATKKLPPRKTTKKLPPRKHSAKKA